MEWARPQNSDKSKQKGQRTLEKGLCLWPEGIFANMSPSVKANTLLGQDTGGLGQLIQVLVFVGELSHPLIFSLGKALGGAP